jgi:hypothetical protein
MSALKDKVDKGVRAQWIKGSEPISFEMANALLTQSSNYNSEGTMASTQVTSSL